MFVTPNIVESHITNAGASDPARAPADPVAAAAKDAAGIAIAERLTRGARTPQTGCSVRSHDSSCAGHAGSGGPPVRGGWVLPQVVAPKRR